MLEDNAELYSYWKFSRSSDNSMYITRYVKDIPGNDHPILFVSAPERWKDNGPRYP